MVMAKKKIIMSTSEFADEEHVEQIGATLQGAVDEIRKEVVYKKWEATARLEDLTREQQKLRDQLAYVESMINKINVEQIVEERALKLLEDKLATITSEVDHAEGSG